MLYQETPAKPAITLQTLKKQLNLPLDWPDDDSVLEMDILAATSLAEHIMRREVIQRQDAKALATEQNGVPPTVQMWVTMYASKLYSTRESDDGTSAEASYAHRHLLDPWIIYDREDDEEDRLTPEEDSDAAETPEGG